MSTPKATTQTLLEQVISSVLFRKSMRRASRLSRNLPGILKLLQQTLRKTQTMGTSAAVTIFREKIVALGRMLKSYATGEYRDISNQSLLILLASFLYFVFPIDLLPDFLPIVGFTDDIALVVFVYQKLQEEIERFELWEKENGR
ncbi:MAG: YkvA family protein [Spirosomataceae bacterium]